MANRRVQEIVKTRGVYMREQLLVNMVVVPCKSLQQRGRTEIIAVDLILPASITQAKMMEYKPTMQRQFTSKSAL
jgi:hypothetical protein